MMSGRPIFVYASPITGIVDYAKREKWACVVDKKSQDAIVNALRKLIQDDNLRNNLIRTSIEVALRNHDENKVRRHFLESIQSVLVS